MASFRQQVPACVIVKDQFAHICPQIIDTLEAADPEFKKLHKPQQELVWTLTKSAINLLASLAGAQDEIVQAIGNFKLISKFLIGLLKIGNVPAEVLNEVLSCLLVLTEENKIFADDILNLALEELLKMMDAKNVLSVPACGVLHNCFVSAQWFDHNTPVEGVSDAILVPTLVGFMKPLSSQFNGHDTHSDPEQVLQLALEITASIATSLQEALEHGSRYEKEFEGFDDTEHMNEDDEDMEGGEEDAGADAEEDDEMDEDQIDADMELVTRPGADSPMETGDPIEQVTLDRLVRIATPQVLEVAIGKMKEEGEITQNQALQTLNNIAWTISNIDFAAGYLNSVHKIWVKLATDIWRTSVTVVLDCKDAEIDMISTITSLAWGLVRGTNGGITITPGEQRKFMAVYEAAKKLELLNPTDGESDAFQSLGVKCIGVLGSLARNPAPIDLNREIGIFLLKVLHGLPKPLSGKTAISDATNGEVHNGNTAGNETPVADAVEALNQIFEIYDDKSHSFDGPVFWGDNFYKHLEEILPKAKHAAKSIDKRKLPELRERADDAVEDLRRFLLYKKKEKASVED
jgi:hypothetical protein